MHYLHQLSICRAERHRFSRCFLGRSLDVYGAGIFNSIDERGKGSRLNNLHNATYFISVQCQHLALIGDHQQLPPIITSPEALEGGLGVSLFERLINEKG